ncbi:hypothetical protein [Streptomyces wuyuanensis]
MARCSVRAASGSGGTEQLGHTFALIDLLPYGRQEDRHDSPEGRAAAAHAQRLGGPGTSPLHGPGPADGR